MVAEMDLTWVIPVISFLSGGAGAYVGSYLKKKGENLATHEDIDKLVDQVRAVTQTTKEIEAKISNEMWERQRRWDVRKDAIFEAVKELGNVQKSLESLLAAYMFTAGHPEDAVIRKSKNDLMNEHQAAFAGFLRAKMLATLVCGKEIRDQFDRLEGKSRLMLAHVITGEMTSGYDELHEFLNGTYQLARLIRSELHIDDPVQDLIPLSNESSAG